jgi:hypothetical protein
LAFTDESDRVMSSSAWNEIENFEEMSVKRGKREAFVMAFLSIERGSSDLLAKRIYLQAILYLSGLLSKRPSI